MFTFDIVAEHPQNGIYNKTLQTKGYSMEQAHLEAIAIITKEDSARVISIKEVQ